MIQVLLTLNIMFLWVASCFLSYVAGNKKVNRKQQTATKKPKKPIIVNEKYNKFLHELENLFSYDGSIQA